MDGVSQQVQDGVLPANDLSDFDIVSTFPLQQIEVILAVPVGVVLTLRRSGSGVAGHVPGGVESAYGHQGDEEGLCFRIVINVELLLVG